MPEIGQTILHYRILEKIGVGGMGEVYLADDTTLDRNVALKFLPEVFTSDPERMARFEREAKLLASLNHPNIAGIYGLEQADRNRFLVLEYVEGETLQARLSKGALPLEDALSLCRQIAEGLEAAHEKGVIHRDLKPSNVMITGEEKVKILDFGLAKALSDEAQNVDSSRSPTLTETMTRPGVILGTAAYMSPEQAKGKSVDKRADIWAFGCILYECLTGKKAFEGETVTEMLAAVLKNEPDWQKMPRKTMPGVRLVLRRCLEKDARRRFHHAADIRIELEQERSVDESKPPAMHFRLWLTWSAVILLLILAVALAFMRYREKTPASDEPIVLQIIPPVNVHPNTSFALSPDGRHLAFVGTDSDGITRLWVRSMNSIEARPLLGTEANYIPPFFWSPDSRYIAFDAGGKLKKIDISGGPASTICDLSRQAVGGSWNRNDEIIFGTRGGNVMRVSAAGGTASPLTKLFLVHQETDYLSPIFLPDGKHFLYHCQSARVGTYLGSLDFKPEEQVSKLLVPGAFQIAYTPSISSGRGWLLFLREKTLMAQMFDEKRLEPIGEPLRVAEKVGRFSFTSAFFSVSTNGILVYRSAEADPLSRISWFDRQGKALSSPGEPGIYAGLSLSPDGSKAAVGFAGGSQDLLTPDLHLIDLARGTLTRLTFGKGDNRNPVWSPDGTHIIFTSSGRRPEEYWTLYQISSSGTKEEELLLKSSEYPFPTSWSRDGRFLLYDAFKADANTYNCNMSILPLQGNRKPVSFLSHEFNERDGHFSPDMRWVAYTSDESGTYEVYVCGFSQSSPSLSSAAGSKTMISKGGGMGPRWGKNGKELYYRTADGRVMVVEVTPGKQFQAGTPKLLFSAPLDISETSVLFAFPTWDAVPDGNRFLLPVPLQQNLSSPFTVVLDWTSMLKK